MTNSFHCPSCKTVLNPRSEIIMLLKCGDQKNLALFSPNIGDYTFYKPAGLCFRKGEIVEFSCPACHEHFRSPVADDLGEILRRESDGTFSRVGFSRTYGKHATFIISSDKQIESHGLDAGAYDEVNWFGASGFWQSEMA